MLRWTIDQVARALEATRPSAVPAPSPVAGASIDSRSVKPGEVFFAIHGPRHDGHEFVSEVLARGAVAVVISQDRWADFPGAVQSRAIGVADTVAALGKLAREVCRAWRGSGSGRRVAGVAGSVGKTTTKEILAALLSARYRVLKSQGNLNNEFGLPLTLLQLNEAHEAVVLEMGMSRAGELGRLAKIAEPDAGVITRVAVEHLEFFSSIGEIAKAERELIENLPGPSAAAVLNLDDERVARFADVAPGKVIWFGESHAADFRAENIEDRGIRGTTFDFVWPEGRQRLELPLAGRHNVGNALAALAAASEWGVGAAEAREVFPRLQPAEMRGEIVEFEAGFTVINDSYNSSPLALAAAAELIAATEGYRRRILAAGEMLELGAESAELHRDAGRSVGAAGKADWIIGVRGAAAEMVGAAIEAGHPRDRAKFFDTSEEAAGFLAGFLESGDLLLIKGSRGVRMEKILAALEARHRVKDGKTQGAVSVGRGHEEPS